MEPSHSWGAQLRVPSASLSQLLSVRCPTPLAPLQKTSLKKFGYRSKATSCVAALPHKVKCLNTSVVATQILDEWHPCLIYPCSRQLVTNTKAMLTTSQAQPPGTRFIFFDLTLPPLPSVPWSPLLGARSQPQRERMGSRLGRSRCCC